MAFPSKPIRLSPFDGMVLKVYVRLLLAFQNTSPQEALIKVLQQSLNFTVDEFPALAGLVSDADDKGNLVVNNFSPLTLATKLLPDFPSYDQLAAKNMPIDQLPADELCPVGPMPQPGVPGSTAAFQVNFIPGGIILASCLHHSVFDGTGSATILRTWAENTRRLTDDVDYRPTRISSQNSINVSPLLDADQLDQFGPHPELAVVNPSSAPPFTIPTVPSVVKVFSLSTESSARLKTDVAALVPDSRISLNDCLSALLWKSVSAARKPHLDSDAAKNKTLKLGIAVDGRTRTSIPVDKEYVYNMGLYCTTSAELNELSRPDLDSLARTAKSVRTLVDGITDTHVKSYLGYLRSVENLGWVQPGWTAYYGKDYTITSWASNGLYDLDWGSLLGNKASYVRLPAGAFDGVAIVLPKRVDGTIEVVMGLREDDMKRILEDKRFTSYMKIFAE